MPSDPTETPGSAGQDRITDSAAAPTPEQAKANADAAFAVGALCGALGAVGREVIAAKIQHRFEEVIAAQEVPDDAT